MKDEDVLTVEMAASIAVLQLKAAGLPIYSMVDLATKLIAIYAAATRDSTPKICRMISEEAVRAGLDDRMRAMADKLRVEMKRGEN